MLRTVAALYDNNHCRIGYKGGEYPGFVMTNGILQGCPLSPLLYALAADALLEKIRTTLPAIWVGAYADDTAVVVSNFWEEGRMLADIFEEFGKISNLRLNHLKRLIIPLHPNGPALLRPVNGTDLWPGPPDDPDDAPIRSLLSTNMADLAPKDPLESLRQRLREHMPAWREMSVAWHGIYLGFPVGPRRADQTWLKAMEKYELRSRIWAGHEHGLQYNALTYNSFAISTLGYVSQLETPPPWAFERERTVLRKVARGPGNWATPADL